MGTAAPRGWALVDCLDAANESNSVSRATVSGSLASVLPSLLPFVGQLYGGDPPSLFFRVDDRERRRIPSQAGAQ